MRVTRPADPVRLCTTGRGAAATGLSRQRADLLAGDRGGEREVFGASPTRMVSMVPGRSPDRVRRRFGQDEQPSLRGFAGALELQGERAAERRDLFSGAHQREGPAALRPDGDDRLLEDRRGGLDAGACRSTSSAMRCSNPSGPRDGQFEGRASGYAVRDLFEGARDAAVGDLDRRTAARRRQPPLRRPSARAAAATRRWRR